MISFRRPPNLPWRDQYGLEPFKEETGQCAIAEKATEIYDQPNLALKGGFFLLSLQQKRACKYST